MFLWSSTYSSHCNEFSLDPILSIYLVSSFLWCTSFTQVIIAFWPYTGQLIIWCHYWPGNEDLQSYCHLSPIHPESNTWHSEKYMAFYSWGFSILTRFYAEGSWSPQFIPSDVTNPANTPWWLSEVTKFNYSLPWCQIKHCIKRQRKSSHSTGR